MNVIERGIGRLSGAAKRSVEAKTEVAAQSHGSDLQHLAFDIRETLVERQSLGYTIALTAVFGGLTAYIASIQQIVFDTFQAPDAIALVFAVIAAPMALASWLNAKIVERFGLRQVGHLGLIERARCATISP